MAFRVVGRGLETGDNPPTFRGLTTRMIGVQVIQFTQDQMRSLTGVSVETLRHWRSVVPYLASKSGKAARFGFGDVVGLAVLRELVDHFGLQVGSVSDPLDQTFRLLAAASFADLEASSLRLTAQGARLGRSSAAAETTDVELVVLLAPIVQRLRGQMLPVGDAPIQAPLPYPPRAVRGRS